jgi:HAD superfamily hydrolase (TIGR01509 family)
MNDFEGVFTSFELKARKPEAVIFERLLRSIRIAPEKLLYIDDRKENLVAARKAGFQVEHCPDPTHLKQVLEKCGLLP